MSFEACESSNFTISVPFEGFGIAGAVRSKYCMSLLFRELNELILLPVVSVSESQLFFRVPPSLLIILLYIIYIFNNQ